jgi:hypothetical protein
VAGLRRERSSARSMTGLGRRGRRRRGPGGLLAEWSDQSGPDIVCPLRGGAADLVPRSGNRQTLRGERWGTSPAKRDCAAFECVEPQRWPEKHDAQPGEDTALGLILCAVKSAKHVELLQLEKSGIRVAKYLTELPPRELLEKKLHESIRQARNRLVNKSPSIVASKEVAKPRGQQAKRNKHRHSES